MQSGNKIRKSTVVWLFSSSTVQMYDSSPETTAAAGGDAAGAFFCIDSSSSNVYIQDGSYVESSDLAATRQNVFGFYSVSILKLLVHELVHRFADEIGFSTTTAETETYYYVEGGADLISEEVFFCFFV